MYIKRELECAIRDKLQKYGVSPDADPETALREIMALLDLQSDPFPNISGNNWYWFSSGDHEFSLFDNNLGNGQPLAVFSRLADAKLAACAPDMMRALYKQISSAGVYHSEIREILKRAGLNLTKD